MKLPFELPGFRKDKPATSQMDDDTVYNSVYGMQHLRHDADIDIYGKLQVGDALSPGLKNRIMTQMQDELGSLLASPLYKAASPQDKKAMVKKLEQYFEMSVDNGLTRDIVNTVRGLQQKGIDTSEILGPKLPISTLKRIANKSPTRPTLDSVFNPSSFSGGRQRRARSKSRTTSARRSTRRKRSRSGSRKGRR